MKKLLFVCMGITLNFFIVSSDIPVSTIHYMNRYNIPQDYKMSELVVLNDVIEEVVSKGCFPLTNQQYWGIIANESDIFYACISMNNGKNIINRLGQTTMKRIVAEYILVTCLQDHSLNLDGYKQN